MSTEQGAAILDLSTGDIALPMPAFDGPSGALRATSDREAIAAWLAARARSSVHTFVAYKRSSEILLRFLDDKKLGLADLRVEHVHEMLIFMASDTSPWLGTQFILKPLGRTAVSHHFGVMQALCDWLVAAGYLARNVLRLVRIPKSLGIAPLERALTLEDWAWLLSRQDAIAPSAKDPLAAARSRWMLVFLYHTGLRREELAKALFSDVRVRDGVWSISVLGKGQKRRSVTLNSAVVAEMCRFRSMLGMTETPSPTEMHPLVPRVKGRQYTRPLTPRMIGLILEGIFADAANACTDEQMRARFIAASTHWLRHTCASHRLAAGARQETTQDELGHADPRTTRQYAHTTGEQRRKDAELLANLAMRNSANA